MKETGAKIAKRVASVLLAATLMFSMTGCGKTAAKSLPKESIVQLQEMNFNTDSHAYIYDTTVSEHIEVTKTQQKQNTPTLLYRCRCVFCFILWARVRCVSLAQ